MILFIQMMGNSYNYWYHDRGMGSTDLIIADAQERARYRTVREAYRWVNWGKNKQKQGQV